jgi:hypothetical protein
MTTEPLITPDDTADPLVELILNTPLDNLVETVEKSGLYVKPTAEELESQATSWNLLTEFNKLANVFQDVEVEVSNPDELAVANNGKYMETFNISL